MAGLRGSEQTLRWRLLALVLVTPLLVLSASTIAQATTPAIDQAAADVRALSALLDEMYRDLSAAAEEYDYANQQLANTQAAVKQMTLELTQAQQDLAVAQDQFDQRLVDIYKSRDFGALDILLSADSFSKLIASLDELARISERDSSLVDEVQAYEALASDHKAQLEAQQQQQEIYAAEAAVAKQKVLDQVAKQKEALKGKEALLAQLKKEEAERQARLKAEAEARARFLASRPGKVISLAMKYLGVPYVWGGASPSGFDCSGLVMYCYATVGVSLPHSSAMQYGCGTPISQSQLKPGDLVFFYHPIHHVGIYIGNGQMINATGTHVQISNVWQASYYGACRVLL